MNVNKVMLVGRITNDLELKTTTTGREVLSFGVATNRTWKNDAGEKQEKTEFHNIVVWGKQAATVAQYFVKGQEIYVEGRLETRTWDSEDGKKNYRTEVIMDRFEFGAKPGGYGGSGQTAAPAAAAGAVAAQAPETAGAAEVAYPTDEIDPEDIPF